MCWREGGCFEDVEGGRGGLSSKEKASNGSALAGAGESAAGEAVERRSKSQGSGAVAAPGLDLEGGREGAGDGVARGAAGTLNELPLEEVARCCC